MKFDHFEHRIASHYLSALINGDHSGLSDDEEKAFTDWLDSTDRRIRHWDCDDESNFTRCEVSGLLADTVIVRGFFPLEV